MFNKLALISALMLFPVHTIASPWGAPVPAPIYNPPFPPKQPSPPIYNPPAPPKQPPPPHERKWIRNGVSLFPCVLLNLLPNHTLTQTTLELETSIYRRYSLYA